MKIKKKMMMLRWVIQIVRIKKIREMKKTRRMMKLIIKNTKRFLELKIMLIQ
jgi:hypothetical protein